ncbi:MAG: aminotransferase class I/II-fold pyridoxal phosphate-dependent enzyme [Cyanobacteria bacterium J06555_13]
MKAIILAAGEGRRLRPLTRTVHKTLLKVNGKALIEWMIDSLLTHQITDITIVTGYLVDELKTFVNSAYPQLTVRYVHNSRYSETNNIVSLAIALENTPLTTDVLLLECDLIFEPAVLQRLLEAPYPNVALVDRYRIGHMDGTVVSVKKDGAIAQFIPPQQQDDGFDFTDKYKTLNIYRLSKEFCQDYLKSILSNYARTVDDNAYYELILGLLVYLNQSVIYAVILEDEKWAEIDDPHDLNTAKFLFEPQQRKALLEASHGGFWNYDVLDFCYLRNMYFPTESVLCELRSNLTNVLHNYGSSQTILNQKLAYFLRCEPQRVVALNGAAQVFPFLRQQFANKPVVIPTPTFGEYARMFPQAQTYNAQHALDWQQLGDRAKQGSLIVIVNPNNPTGTTVQTEQIYQFALAHPQVAICVDESFIDFSDQDSLQPLLEARPLSNTFVLKSLSKSLGVPGLRLGYVYTTNKALQKQLEREVPIWNMNSVAEHFLERLLKHREAIAASFERTKQDRAEFSAQLETMPLVEQVYPSGGNFLLVRVGCDRATLAILVENMLAQHNIYLKDISNRFDDDQSYLRFAVRLPQEHQHLIACWKTAVAELRC